MPRGARPSAKPKKEKPSRAKKPPKAAPVSAVKAELEMAGPRPLSSFDLQFCHIFVQTQKQVEAWRQLRPEDKDPHKQAHRMMQRPEIREHIREIYRQIGKARQQAAVISARANLLSLEIADDRLVEILQTPRKTLGHMLTRDTRQIHMKGARYVPGTDGEEGDYILDPEFEAALEGPAPAEDADLLKAIKLAYDRKQGIIKAEKASAATHTTVMLYKPQWFGRERVAPTLEATVEPA